MIEIIFSQQPKTKKLVDLYNGEFFVFSLNDDLYIKLWKTDYDVYYFNLRSNTRYNTSVQDKSQVIPVTVSGRLTVTPKDV